MSLDSMSIIGAGAVTSVGLSLASTMPAFRAEIDNFQDTSFQDGKNEPIIGAKITGFHTENEDEIVGGLATQYQWLCLSIDEALSYINLDDYEEYCVMVISPSEKQPSLIDYQSLYQQTVEYSQTIIAEERLYHLHLPLGEIGSATAIMKAEKWLTEQANRAVILVGSDSWLNVSRIDHGLKNKRFLCDSQDEGFIPGEGASAVVLVKESQSKYAALSILATSIEEESRPLFSERNSTANGLTKATKSALTQSGIEPHEVELMLNDLTGEEYFFAESALSWAKTLRTSLPEHYEKHFALTNVGNLGAVNGLFLLAYAWALQIKGQHPGKNTLIQLTSEDSQRAAIVAVTN